MSIDTEQRDLVASFEAPDGFRDIDVVLHEAEGSYSQITDIIDLSGYLVTGVEVGVYVADFETAAVGKDLDYNCHIFEGSGAVQESNISSRQLAVEGGGWFIGNAVSIKDGAALLIDTKNGVAVSLRRTESLHVMGDDSLARQRCFNELLKNALKYQDDDRANKIGAPVFISEAAIGRLAIVATEELFSQAA